MIDGVPDHRQCIVIGAGLLGLSSAWVLARRGWDVLVLEAAATPGHERSGSKGDARIFRLGYPEAQYVEMALLARTRWRDLEAATGRRLLHVTGQVTFGDEATLHAIADSLVAAGAPVEKVSATAAAQRFPGIDLSGPVLVEPDSGVLAADACLGALRQAGDFEVRTGGLVTSVRHSSGNVIVETVDGTPLSAAIVVVCAGPGSLALLGVDPAAACSPSLPQVAYFAARDGDLPPVFIEWGNDMVYGLPVTGSGSHAGTYKVSRHTPGPAVPAFDPTDAAALGGDDPAQLAQLTTAVARLLPGLDPEPVATERCVYDNTADADFVLDRVGSIVVGCGTSGHAFKFGPLLGEMLADLAEDRHPAVDLTRFSLRRDALGPGGRPPAPR
jgi:glycine/D-amino acid oxidase-like deaminating enzyme